MAAVQRPEELHPRVMARVEELCAIVRQRLPNFLTPAVGYFDKKGCAGMAYYGSHRIELHREVLRAHTDETLRDTVAHEVAHLATYALGAAGRIPMSAARGHGRHWRGVMRVWFGIEPKRTTTTGVEVCGARRQHVWLATCGCPTGCRVRTVVKNKMARGASYRCGRCKQRLAFPDQRVS
jgi:SprT protein